MPNPVQVVLNTRDYFVAPEPGRMGPPKDFFADRDQEFIQHRERLRRQVASVSTSFRRSGLSEGVIKVTLRKEALAKSHRPHRVLFPPDRRPCVGASRLGELFYLVSARDLQEIDSNIAAAEDRTTHRVSRTGREYIAPSSNRGDTGAIESIALPTAADKRRFSAEEAVAWLSNPRTSSAYLVELFAMPPHTGAPNLHAYERAVLEQITAAASATNLLIESYPVAITRGQNVQQPTGIYGLRLLNQIDRLPSRDVAQHQRLLGIVESHPYVKRILLPPLLRKSNTPPATAIVTDTAVTIPAKNPNVRYPKVAVIDGGISASLGSWVIGEHDLVAPEHRDTDHGTFIAGLLVAGQQLNNTEVCPEADGCDLIDVAIFPDETQPFFDTYYPRGVLDFINEISAAVAAAKRDHGVRIFNMSLNLVEPVEDDTYGFVASFLDSIADQHGVIFVISAGNLDSTDCRAAWPRDAQAALLQLAARTASDTILQPCESARSLAVGALNPPSCAPSVHGAPAAYSRRGPGLRVGVKPDVAHFGGAVHTASGDSGLHSIQPDASVCSGTGTSFASPLVAKTLATLESRVERQLTPEELIALLLHHSETPSCLSQGVLSEVARQFIGFGLPRGTDALLFTPDRSITLVFADVLQRSSKLEFNFAWPRCLVDIADSSCRGEAKMTLVYRPPLDRNFGSEFVRVNVDAYLRQEEGSTYRNRISQCFLPSASAEGAIESSLIENGLKWWPSKVYKARFPQGKGSSSNWQLAVESVARSGEPYPPRGIPFAVVLSISGFDESDSVFSDMRMYLRARNVQIADIRARTQVRIQP